MFNFIKNEIIDFQKEQLKIKNDMIESLKNEIERLNYKVSNEIGKNIALKKDFNAYRENVEIFKGKYNELRAEYNKMVAANKKLLEDNKHLYNDNSTLVKSLKKYDIEH